MPVMREYNPENSIDAMTAWIAHDTLVDANMTPSSEQGEVLLKQFLKHDGNTLTDIENIINRNDTLPTHIRENQEIPINIEDYVGNLTYLKVLYGLTKYDTETILSNISSVAHVRAESKIKIYNMSSGKERTSTDTLAHIYNYYTDQTTYIDGKTSLYIALPTYNEYSDRFYPRVILFVFKSGNNYYKINGELLSNRFIKGCNNTNVKFMILKNFKRLRDLILNGISSDSISDLIELCGKPFNIKYSPSTRNIYMTNIYTNEEESIPLRTDLQYGYHTHFELKFRCMDTKEDKSNTRFFGIELEIDRKKSLPKIDSSTHKNIVLSLLNHMLNNDDYNKVCKFERDGSLSDNGIEIIFQPMTMEFLNSEKDNILDTLKMLSLMGYSSHDVRTCGLHVHVSRTELPDKYLRNAIFIFENFKNELIAFSRRNESQMHWAKFMSDEDYNNEFITDEVIEHYRRYDATGHGSVINNDNAKTVEFRLFRGTINPKTFYATVQLMDNIVELSNNDDFKDITWSDIINKNDNYVELKEYNETRQIYSTHKATHNLNKQAAKDRGVLLVTPFMREATESE